MKNKAMPQGHAQERQTGISLASAQTQHGTHRNMADIIQPGFIAAYDYISRRAVFTEG